jgi:cyclase
LRRIRVIPVLQIQDSKLVKSLRFREFQYLGDPINAVKIFNDKEVDELVLLDVSTTQHGRAPDFQHIEEIVSEAFMPIAYGGGISRLDQIDQLFRLGVEKVIVSTAVAEHMSLVTEASQRYGAQSIVGCVNVKRRILGGYFPYVRSGQTRVKESAVSFCERLEKAGAGEIIVVSIERDGTFSGYDIDFLSQVTSRVAVPVVACGGAASIEDFYLAVTRGGCSATAAGSMFAFRNGNRDSVLINYPDQTALIQEFYARI